MQIELCKNRETYISPGGKVFRKGNVYDLEDKVAKALLAKKDEWENKYFQVYIEEEDDNKPISTPETVIDNTGKVAKGDVVDDEPVMAASVDAWSKPAVTGAKTKKSIKQVVADINGDIDTGAAAAQAQAAKSKKAAPADDGIVV